MKKKCLLLLTIIFPLFVFFGCVNFPQTAEEHPNYIPTELPSEVSERELSSITFGNIVYKLPVGKTVGTRYDYSYGGMDQRDIIFDGAKLLQAPGDFRLLGIETLQTFGYNVKGAEELLFGKDKSANADFVIGGEIIDLNFENVVQWADNKSDRPCSSRMKVRWKLFNVKLDEVVFTSESEGFGFSKTSYTEASNISFSNALKNFLSTGALVSELEKRSDRDKPKWGEVLTISIPDPKLEQVDTATNIKDFFSSMVVVEQGLTRASGFIISTDGYVFTAAHFTNGSKSVTVILDNGIELEAVVVRENQNEDVSLLKLPGKGYAPVPILLDETAVNAAEDIFVIGNPLHEDLDKTVTKGIVSAIREFEESQYLQIDVSSNPGVSGGAVLNKDGVVVGMVIGGFRGNEEQGLNFGLLVTEIKKHLELEYVLEVPEDADD